MLPRAQEEVIFDLLHETAYPDSGLGRTILGPVANIKSITREHLQSYISTHYTGPRIVVAGAGAVEHGALSALAESAFGGLPATRLAPALAPPAFVGSQLTLRNDDLNLAYLAIGFETGGWTHPHAFPLMVLQTLLGHADIATTQIYTHVDASRLVALVNARHPLALGNRAGAAGPVSQPPLAAPGSGD